MNHLECHIYKNVQTYERIARRSFIVVAALKKNAKSTPGQPKKSSFCELKFDTFLTVAIEVLKKSIKYM
jgi:hypothetical protein